MNKTLTLAGCLPVAIAFLLSSPVGCKKKEEEPPPMPSAAPAPPPPPVPVAVEEPIAPPAVDAAPDAKKVVTGAPADTTGLRACCAALEQNAASMPPPNNAYALQAAALCKSLVASGMARGGALSAIGQTMKGASMPPACR